MPRVQPARASRRGSAAARRVSTRAGPALVADAVVAPAEPARAPRWIGPVRRQASPLVANRARQALARRELVRTGTALVADAVLAPAEPARAPRGGAGLFGGEPARLSRTAPSRRSLGASWSALVAHPASTPAGCARAAPRREHPRSSGLPGAAVSARRTAERTAGPDRSSKSLLLGRDTEMPPTTTRQYASGFAFFRALIGLSAHQHLSRRPTVSACGYLRPSELWWGTLTPR
jgi:hypothetical protein